MTQMPTTTRSRSVEPVPLQGGRAPAPIALLLLQRFVNTNDLLSANDELTSPPALASWMEAHGLLSGSVEVSDADYQYALRVREAVRTFLSRDRGRPSDLEIDLLDEVGRRARLGWSFDQDGTVRLTARSTGVMGALGTILAPLLSAALTGSLARLKTCRNCRWVFYDYSKNRSGTWCAMGLCGSRAKAKRYYRRTRDAIASGEARGAAEPGATSV